MHKKYYLPENELNVTETVHHFRDFLPHFLPLVHPSPRNQIWIKKNPWFEQEIIPGIAKASESDFISLNKYSTNKERSKNI